MAQPRPTVDLADPAWAELLPDAVCLMDEGYEVVSLRPGISDIDQWFHPADHEALSAALFRSREFAGRVVSVPVRALDPDEGWRRGVASVVDWTTNQIVRCVVIRWRPVRNSDAGSPLASGAVLDDPDAHRTLLDTVPIGIFELDGHGRLTWANSAWRSIVGPFATDEPFDWLGRVHPDDRARIDAALAVARTGEWFHQRYRVRHDVEDWAWIETKVVALGDDGDHVGAVTDITGSVHAEADMASARDAALETSRLKSDFLANMSHEIRTPLNGVIGMATLLLDTPLNRDQRERIVTLRSAGEHLLVLVNDILDFSKVETGRLELESVEFDLLPVLSQVVSLYSSAGFDKGVRLRVDTDAALPRAVVGDPGRLRQVLSNLVGNAVKFTETGSVTIRATAEGRRSTVVRFEVIDTGIGISAEAQGRIFDPFVQADSSTTRRFGGTGLGLPISRRLVQLMGGVLSVESQPARGSTFWFTIPFGDASTLDTPMLGPGLAAEVTAPAPVTERSRGKVLLVEDNPINQQVAVGFLARLGWDADVADDGLDGVEAATANRYSAILMDCQMPRMDGYEATQRIRQHEGAGARTPIIALTAGAMPGDRERCLAAGMDDYLSKPIDVVRLDEVLRNWAMAPATHAEPTDEATEEAIAKATVESTDEHPEPGLLDTEVIEQLRALDGGQLLDEVLAQFRGDAPSRVDRIVTALGNADWPTTRREAHALKGMSATVGARALSEAAAAAERAGEPSSPEPVVLAGRLERELQRALEAASPVSQR